MMFPPVLKFFLERVGKPMENEGKTMDYEGKKQWNMKDKETYQNMKEDQ